MNHCWVSNLNSSDSFWPSLDYTGLHLPVECATAFIMLRWQSVEVANRRRFALVEQPRNQIPTNGKREIVSITAIFTVNARK